MGEIATRARWTLNSATARNVKLQKVKSYSESDDSDIELVYNVSDDGPVGVIDKPGGGSIEFDYYFETGVSEVDWRELKAAKEFFSLTKQVVSGERLQYLRCRIANIASDGDDQGSHMQKVRIMWSECKAL